MPLINKLIRLTENATVQYGEVTRSINNTSFSDTVRMEIHVDQPKRLYTSGDIISGQVTVVLKREVDIAELTLKYKIDEATEIVQYIMDKKHKNKQHKETFKSAGRVYEKAVRLFPLEHDIGELSMQKLTLPPGTHEYPFSVRIPGHNNDGYKVLPPSFLDQDQKGSICHTLKVTLKRSSSFKQNSRVERPLEFIPRAPPNLLNQPQWVHFEGMLESGGMFNRSGTLVKLAVSLPKVVQAGEPLPLQVFGESVDAREFAIIDSRIELARQAVITAQNHQEVHVFNQTLAQCGIGAKGTKLNVSDKFGHVRFPVECIPSFHTKFIAVRYRLEFIFRVSTGTNTKISTFKFYGDLDVVGPSCFVYGNEHTNQMIGSSSKQYQSPPAQPQYPPEKASYHQSGPSASLSPNQYPPEKTSGGNSLSPSPVQGTGQSHLASNNPFSPQNTGAFSAAQTTNNQEPRDDAPPAYSG